MEFSSKVASQTLLDEIKRDQNKNILVSPLSINAILNMITAGSSGPTLEQLLKFLGFVNIKHLNTQFSKFMDIATTKNNKRKRDDLNNKEGPLLSFVNGVWISKLFKLADSYENIVKTVYKAEARNVDFSKANEVVKEVNKWAKSASKGLINDVLTSSDITNDTKLILGNALYFKGSWVKPFKSEWTKDKDFYLLNGDKVKAPFMTGCTEYTYGSFTGFQVVKIPYEMGNDKKRRFSMCIFLPNKKNGLRRLLKKVKSDSEFLAKHLELKKRWIKEFYIPKFKFEYRNEKVVEKMQKLGLTNLKVTEMVNPSKELSVTKIIQKTFIEIDEKGAEAVAVTVAHEMETCCAPSRKREVITFVADHPFMFTIMEERSGLVFFTGAVLNPLIRA